MRVASELVLSGPDWFPLGGEQGPDPLRLVLGQLADLGDEEQALVQVVARPATAREQRRLLAAAQRIRAGVPTSRTLRLLELVLPGPPPQRPTLDPTVSPDVRAVLEKASHPLYRCLVRLERQRARTSEVARGRMHALAGAFAAYEGRVGLRRRRVRGAERKLRLRTLGRRGYLLSIPELAALAHLPAERALPGLLRAGARSVSPPPGLPASGKPLGRDCARRAGCARGRRRALPPAPARPDRGRQVDADRAARARRSRRRPRRGRDRPEGRPGRGDPRPHPRRPRAAGRSCSIRSTRSRPA